MERIKVVTLNKRLLHLARSRLFLEYDREWITCNVLECAIESGDVGLESFARARMKVHAKKIKDACTQILLRKHAIDKHQNPNGA